MRGRYASLLAMVAVAGTPVRAQSLTDTLRQLRSTVRQLGGRSQPANGATPSAVAPQTLTAAQASDASMVPATVLADDASDTGLETAVLVQRRVATFDVRGLRLGMSPREVGRIADRQQFRRRWNGILSTSGTFEAEATALASSQLNRPIEKDRRVQLRMVEGWDPDGDQLTCTFTLEPGGPRLSRVVFNGKLNGLTQAQAFTALARKYGAPTGDLDNAMIRSWTNAVRVGDGSSPSLYAAVDGGTLMLTLQQSADYRNAAKRRLSDRAQQIAAARGGGVRF